MDALAKNNVPSSERRMSEPISFEEACECVKVCMDAKWKGSDDLEKMKMLEREKAAILGDEEQMQFYKQEIAKIIEEQGIRAGAPMWYKNLTEGIFAELYGLAGLAPWVYDESEEYRNSSSAKLIGDRLYCLIDGRSQLQLQRISSERRQQLRRALLMGSPRQRMDQGFHEVYLSNGIRVTIYAGDRTKPDQDIMVFRKYLLQDDLSFEKLASLGTIPEDACLLLEMMTRIGFNVLIAGTVRSGKTTFLQIWQSYESMDKEGLAISTDPETPWDKIMPHTPIMQLVADGEDLDAISKSLLRGDNDYVILEEMRDARSFRLAMEIAGIGTGRCKATVHSGDIPNLPYKIASKIRSMYGGDEQSLILQVFTSFHYIFEFGQLESNRAVKKLKSIYELCYDVETDNVSMWQICRYDEKDDRWRWNAHIGKDKDDLLCLWPEEAAVMREQLEKLTARCPIVAEKVIYPRYYHPNMKEREGAHG